jgi:hypothetical protein
MQGNNSTKSIKQLQLEHEYEAWERSLEFFRQENTLLKYRLSEMVDNIEENKFLQMAEYFQNELLIKDEKLNELTKCLQMFSGKMNTVGNQKEGPKKPICELDTLRKNILKFEKKFLVLVKDFNEKLLSDINV